MKYSNSWLDISRDVARAFISENFISEGPLFDVYWNMFSSRINERLLKSHGNLPSFEESQEVVSEIYFSQKKSLDLVTPIVLATVAETISKINAENLSGSGLKKFISTAAARFGAKPSLTAALVNHLPSLCAEALGAKDDISEGIISRAPATQYTVWIDGEVKTVSDISEYEKHKEKYLFWLDLDQTSHRSKVNPGKSIGPEAVRLLEYLLEKLGATRPISDVLKDAFLDDTSEITDAEKNKIEQQITKLHQYCGGRFRQYLFKDKFKNGLGLMCSFGGKYCLFSRLR